jgi:cell division protein FtsQ
VGRGCDKVFSGRRFSRPCSGVRQSDAFSKRGTAVLEAPEQSYASESGGPRRVSASPNRKLRRDFDEELADDFGDDEGAPTARRRGGLRLRFRGLPKTVGGRIAGAAVVALCLGICAGVVLMARSVLLHDERFFIPSSSSVEFVGDEHVTRAQLMSVFGADIERNIFSVDLAQRRLELERLPWVAHATVMRLLPNRMRVSVVERTPVAFVRQGNHIGLVDGSGVLLDMPGDAKGNADYSFPVVSGIVATDPLSTRAARMKIFSRFTSDLDSSGQKISEGLSEVDLSNPEDVKALIPDHSNEILVHFGDADFLERYRRFEDHLPEWRTAYPKLSSVDMRYERQVVLEMQPGSTTSVAGGDAANAAPAPSDVKAAKTVPPARVVSKAAAMSGAKPHAATMQHGAAVKNKPGVKTVAHGTAASQKQGGAASKAHAAAGKHPPVVVGHSSSTSKYHPPQVTHP